MRHASSRAVILQTTDYAEADKIVSLYTKEFGRISAIARHAKKSRKRFGSALEPFTLVEVQVTLKEHGLNRLEQCRIIEQHGRIAVDIKKLAYGHYILELIHNLTPERDSNPDIFSLLVYCISQLTGAGFREGFMRLFELRLFSLLGYQPQFYRCVSCRQPFSLRETYTFSVKMGGIVCSACTKGRHDLLPLSKGTIRIFQQAQNLQLVKLNRICFSAAEQEEGKNIFGRFLEYHMGRRPKSLEIIKQFM